MRVRMIIIKKIFFISAILITIFVSGCNGNNKEFFLTLEEKGDDYVEIYEFSDSTKIYSIFSLVKVKFDDNKEYNLSEALDKKLLTIDDIIKNMVFYGEVNDGGTKTYENNNNKFANVNFTIAKCHSSNNIIIGIDTTVADACRTNH